MSVEFQIRREMWTAEFKFRVFWVIEERREFHCAFCSRNSSNGIQLEVFANSKGDLHRIDCFTH